MNLEQIYEPNGWRISRSPEVILYLEALLKRTPGISHTLTSICVDEQREGNAGGLHFSAKSRDTGRTVLIKVGVEDGELYWARKMYEADPGIMPELYASGETLGDLKLGWIAMERLAFCVNQQWQGNEFVMFLEAAARFQKAARAVAPRYIEVVDPEVLHEWMHLGMQQDPPGPAEVVFERVKEDFRWITSVCPLEPGHGDLRLGNGVTDTPPPQISSLKLIDFGGVPVQPWAFDAGYLQVINSTDRKREPSYRDLIPKLARFRAGLGLESCGKRDLPRLSRIVLAWFAIRQWGWNPVRHNIADYRAETERYIEEGADARV